MIYSIAIGFIVIALTVAYVMSVLEMRKVKEQLHHLNDNCYLNECKVNGIGSAFEKVHDDIEGALKKVDEEAKNAIAVELKKTKKETERKDLWIMSMLTYAGMLRDKAHSLHIDFAKMTDKDLVKLIELSIQADADQMTWQECSKKCKELGIDMEVK